MAYDITKITLQYNDLLLHFHYIWLNITIPCVLLSFFWVHYQ